MRFLYLSRITAEAAVLTLLVILVSRVLLRRLEPGVKYFLWIFVALRILVPVRVEILPEVPGVTEWVWRGSERTKALPEESAGEFIEASGTDSGYHAGGQTKEAPPEDSAGESPERAEEVSDRPVGGQTKAALPEDSGVDYTAGRDDRQLIGVAAEQTKQEGQFRRLIFCLWLAGAAITAIYLTANNIRLFFSLKLGRKRVGTLLYGIPLYDMPGYNCLAGVFSPAVYIDMEGLKEDSVIEHVILHERQHLKAGDPFWQFLRVICLILQWHNPFIWWAYYASRQDGELACDARVVRGMQPGERYAYGESLLAAAACSCTEHLRGNLATSAGGARRFMERRIKGIMRYRHGYGAGVSAVMICMLGITCFAAFHEPDGRSLTDNPGKGKETALSNAADAGRHGLYIPENGSEDVRTEDSEYRVEISIEEHYITNTGNLSNLYYIDEERVLWGCGENSFGQLGQGPQGKNFYKDMVKIAEEVIHVDCSQEGFTIYLTKDHKLYGMGNGTGGALPRYEKEEWMKHVNREYHLVTEPSLLMEDVAYARCGRSDVACMKTDDSVWIFGTVGYDRDRECFYPYPVKVLEDAALVTGGAYNHAALLRDGSLWTWGDNYAGNCGTTGTVVSAPTQVAEDVAMVWTGRISYNMDCQDLTEFIENYERDRENTMILTKDGSYFICGADVGEEKALPIYYEAGNFPLVCSCEFLPWDGELK